MRKIVFWIGLSTIFLTQVSAQIPSSGFEEWGAFKLPQISDWYAVGNVERSSVSTEGGASVKLTNDPNSDVSMGMVLNTPLESEFSGGFAYSDRPFSLEFDARFDIDTRDTARILALFTYDRNPVGTIDFRWTGSSSDTFQHFTVPITWFGFVNPDSLTMVLASANFESEQSFGDGELYIDNMMFSSVGTPNDTFNNQGFNRWHDLEIAHPKGWFTVDVFMAALTGTKPPVPFVTFSESEKQSGMRSLHLTSRGIDNEITPGIAFTGTGFDDIEKPGFPVSQSYDYLRGHLKYSPVQGDQATISVGMYKAGQLIGYGEYDQSSETDWTSFEVEVEYFVSVTPDSASIIIANSDLDEPKGDGTELWIDGLEFSTWSLTATPSVRTETKAYPNPVRNRLTIDSDTQIERAWLTDQLGRVVAETNTNQLTLNHLPSGIYTLTIKDTARTWQRKITKQ
jgi:hypothetical protein